MGGGGGGGGGGGAVIESTVIVSFCLFASTHNSWAGIHEKSYSQSQTQTYTQSQTQTQPYVSIHSNLVFSSKMLRKYMLKLKFESEIELRTILANQIP